MTYLYRNHSISLLQGRYIVKNLKTGITLGAQFDYLSDAESRIDLLTDW